MTFPSRLSASFLLAMTLIVQPICPADTADTISVPDADIRLREHMRTNQSFVSIVDPENPDIRYPFPENIAIYGRPDYRMLDHRIRSGDIPYDGPVSDSTKIYVLAATLAAGGIAGAALIPVAPAAGASAAGGSGLLTAGSAVVTAGSAAAAYHLTRPHDDDVYTHRTQTRFYDLFPKDSEMTSR